MSVTKHRCGKSQNERMREREKERKRERSYDIATDTLGTKNHEEVHGLVTLKTKLNYL